MRALDVHFFIPQTRKFIVDFPGLLVPDRASDGIVGARKVSLCLEFYIRDESVLWTSDKAVISELVLHFPKKNASCIHIRLRQDAVCILVFFSLEGSRKRKRNKGAKDTYYRSPFSLS